MQSDLIKKGVERAPNRSLLYALGLTDEEIQRPIIGVVSSYNEIIPGHMNIDKIAEAVKSYRDEVFPCDPRPDRRLHRGHGDRPPV